MEYKVVFSDSAKKDLLDLYYYVAVNDSFEKADKLILSIEQKCVTLFKNPGRGFKVKEFNDNYPFLLKIILKPYNIIYQIEGNIVSILAILDGRRDMRNVLLSRFDI